MRRLQNIVDEIDSQIELEDITVRADAHGRLTSLRIGRDAYTKSPETLAELIVRAYDRAADEAQARASVILAELRDHPDFARVGDASPQVVPPMRQSDRPHGLAMSNSTGYDDEDCRPLPKSWLV